jgi:hypothetical protein
MEIIVRNGIMYFTEVMGERIFEVAARLVADFEVYDTDRATPCDSPDPEVVRLLS